MHGGDAAFPVDEERGRHGFNAAVEIGNLVVAEQNPIIHFAGLDVRLHGVPALVIHGYSDHRESTIAVGLVELHEPGDLDLARSAPGGPEVEKHHLAAIVAQVDGSAIAVLQREIGRRFALAGRLEFGRGFRARGGAGTEDGSRKHNN